MAHNRNVKFIKPSEPSFVKAFKAKVGYTEKEVTIETKKEIGPRKDEGDRYIEDELPTIVTDGEVTMEEYKEYMKQQVEESVTKDEEKISSSVGPHPLPKTEPSAETVRIVFKKPNKRTSSETDQTNTEDTTTTTKGLYSSSKRIATPVNKKDQQQNRRNSGGNRKGIKNSSLLSFEDDT